MPTSIGSRTGITREHEVAAVAGQRQPDFALRINTYSKNKRRLGGLCFEIRGIAQSSATSR